MFVTTRRFLILLTLALSSACSVLQTGSEWQTDLPSRSLFVKEYLSDRDNQIVQSKDSYLSWVKRFYNGTVLQPKGWLQITHELALNVAEAQRSELEQTLAALGTNIAKEWSKDNSVRKIDTKNMLVWGTALRESIEKDDIVNLVEQVAADVDALLNSRIDKRDITSDRYYPMEFDEFF